MSMLEKKTWAEFQNTGLLLIVNQFLHIFGWAITVVCEVGGVDGDGNVTEVIEVYPARTDFRGFAPGDVTKAYQKITQYMKDNVDQLEKEVYEGD
jgi:cephalosporin-C deacetylase-like acetyl esterase